MSDLKARVNMIKQQLRTSDVLNEEILNLYDTIPRHEFVPEHYAHFAYSDMQIPLSHGQRMLTPVEEAKILQALDLKGTETVLEVGTGSGFFSALLSKLCKNVLSIDYFPEFTKEASKKAQSFGCNNIQFLSGDGSKGWLENAPYDVIVFTGALEKITDTHKLQVLPGGTLFSIEGTSPIMRGWKRTLDHNGKWHETLLFETDIPLLIDKSKIKEFIF